MKILNIRDIHKHVNGVSRTKGGRELPPTAREFENAIRVASKQGISIGRDGRAYVPEAKR